MNLKQSPRKNGRFYLSIEKSYRDQATGRPKAKTIQSLGYLDVLQKQYDDPIAHFKEIARKMTEAENANMMLLIISRLLSPGSKKKAFEEKGKYFERFDFSLADMYRALSHFAKITDDCQRYLHEQIAAKYGRDTATIYYDVTNFYFAINEADELRKYGKSKESRHNPVVQMGLAMEAEGIPIHYELFPGNKLDKETFCSVIGKVRRKYDTGRVVVVADMGIITGDNIHYLTGGKN